MWTIVRLDKICTTKDRKYNQRTSSEIIFSYLLIIICTTCILDLSLWYVASLWFHYKLFPFNLMQILYLVEVGLLLTCDLLACVDSQGMLYYYPSSVTF